MDGAGRSRSGRARRRLREARKWAWRVAARGAHRERLLALRAVVDGALTYFDERPGGEPLVRVDVEGESEQAG